jgi:transketolase
MVEDEIRYLKEKTRRIRYRALKMIFESQSGHPGASMSLAEILTVLYFRIVKVDPARPEWEQRDRLILSKGHGAPMLYSVLCEKGFFPEDYLQSFRKVGGLLQGHPVPKIPGVDATSGSLGCGLSIGVGMARGLQIKGIEANVYVILGDGELNEGIVWESVMTAKHFGLNNLIAIIDNNKYQNDGLCKDVMNLEPIAPKWKSFGWDVHECNGHDIKALIAYLDKIKNSKNNNPKLIVAHTIKGFGVSYLMSDYKTHYVAPSKEQWESAKKEFCEP